MPEQEIRDNIKLLTSGTAFDLYRSRVTYLLASKEVKAGNAVKDSLLLDYQRLINLERHVEVNTTYSGKQLRDIVTQSGFTTTSRSYLENSLGVIYEYVLESDKKSYTITGKVNQSELIKRRDPVNTTISDSLF